MRINGRVNIKPLSVNKCWQGRRFKTNEYKDYEEEVLFLLPNLEAPEPPYKCTLILGLSNRANDIDNSVKPFIDILQKKYGFNDREIIEMHIFKTIVKKGQEYITFFLETYSCT